MPSSAEPGHHQTAYTPTQADFDAFAELSGDHNPIHVDPAYAATTRFAATVAHGMLLYTRLRGFIEQCYPGARIVSQQLTFPAPSYAGETLTLLLDEEDEEQGKRDKPADGGASSRLSLAIRVVKPDGQYGLTGLCRLQLDRPL